jgi:hypothetical protein
MVRRASGKRRWSDADIVIGSLVGRILEDIDAFVILLRRWNVVGASGHVRPMLDSFLRLRLLWHCGPESECFKALLAGSRLNKVPDPTQPGTKAKLTDRRLVELIGSDYPWLERWYTDGSRWVHYSREHRDVVFKFSKGERGDGLLEFVSNLPPLPESYDNEMLDNLRTVGLTITHHFAESLEHWRIAKSGSQPKQTIAEPTVTSEASRLATPVDQARESAKRT